MLVEVGISTTCMPASSNWGFRLQNRDFGYFPCAARPLHHSWERGRHPGWVWVDEHDVPKNFHRKKNRSNIFSIEKYFFEKICFRKFWDFRKFLIFQKYDFWNFRFSKFWFFKISIFRFFKILVFRKFSKIFQKLFFNFFRNVFF